MASRQRNRLDPSDLNNAQYLTLDFYPLSTEAHALGAKLHELIMGLKVKKKGAGRPPDDGAIGNAALVTVAEIIDVAKGNIKRTVHHGLSPNKFSGRQISFRHFKAAMFGLGKLELVKIRKGSYGHKSGFSDAENPGVVWGYNTRWHPTQKLIELCKSFSITHRNIESHFEIMLPKDPIMLRESSRGSGRNKVKGRTVTYPKTTTTERLKSEINEINEFLKGFKLTGATHRGYRRIYNQGDDLERYKWDKGGRLYGSGSDDHYLIIKKAKRKKMLIDGEATVEIDVRASYLTIFHAMHGIQLALESDPYKIAGLPRWLVKQWMVVAFGAGKPPIRWTPKAIEEFRESKGEKLGKVYNLRKLVTPKIMAAFPVLQKLKIGGFDCFDLMNRESNAMVASILRLLRTHKIPAYSIHDCLIVRKRDEELATSVLKDEYYKATNAVPYLKVS